MCNAQIELCWLALLLWLLSPGQMQLYGLHSEHLDLIKFQTNETESSIESGTIPLLFQGFSISSVWMKNNKRNYQIEFCNIKIYFPLEFNANRICKRMNVWHPLGQCRS